MQAIFGFFGSLVALIATIVAAAVGITFFVMLWKAGSLDETVALVGTFIGGVFNAITGFFGFLRDLLAFATS